MKGLRIAAALAASMMGVNAAAVITGRERIGQSRARTADAHRRQAHAGFVATHVTSTRFVAHDKRDAKKAKNRARHRTHMKRRGK